jgi:hypothetical protein
MRRELDQLHRNSRAAQLPRSSIEGNLLFTDGGVVRGQAGPQPDGKFGWGVVNSDPPPRPDTPQLVATTAGLAIIWNGTFNDVRPSDFTHVQAYVSSSGDTFILDDSNRVGTMLGAGILPVSAINDVPLDTELGYWCRLVAVNSAGLVSEESFAVGPVSPGMVVAQAVLDGIVDTLALADDAVTAAKVAAAQIGLEHIAFTAADLGSIVTYFQASAPTGTIPTGSLWMDSDDSNKLYRYNGTSWVAATNTDIAAALAAATAAQADAADALTAAAGAEAAVDGKVTVFYQSAAPGSGMNTGDLWSDSDDKKLYRWDGDSWESIQDEDIAQAIADAATAQSTADGKIVSFYQASAPTAVAVGDLWYDTDNGNKVSRWNGTTWTALPSGTDAIADDAITGAKIVAETIQGIHIAAETIFGGLIAADTITGDKIQALSIVAGHIAANAIATGNIQAGAITADKLEAILVLASTIIAGDQSTWHLQLGDSETPILYWNGESTGFAVSKDPATGQANVYLSGRVEFGNGSQIESDYLDLAEQPATGFQTPTPRQSRNWVNSLGVTSVAMKWVSATQPGSLLLASIAVLASSGSTAPTITAPAGWTVVGSVTNGPVRLSLYQTPNAGTSHTTDTFTTNIAAAWTNGLYEFRNMASVALDVSATNSGTGTTASTGTTGTTTQTHEMQMAIWAGRAASGITTQQFTGATNGFAQLQAGLSYTGLHFVACTRNTTATGTATSSATLPNSQPWTGLIATFKPMSAAGVPPTPRNSTLRLFARERSGYATPHVIDDVGDIYPVGRVPYCRARLTADYTSPATTDIYAQGDWAATEDPYTMVSISTGAGTYSNITVPLEGMYLVNFKVHFSANAEAPPVNNAACFVTANARSAGNSVARDSRRFNRFGTGDHSPCQAIRVVPLNANDVLYWGTWASVASSVFYNLVTPTEIEVVYLTPKG